MSTYWYSKRYLDSGICEDNNQQFIRCAMEPHECSEENENFRPHVQDETIMKRCNPNDTVIGRCLQEDSCAVRASDCPNDTNESNFEKHDELCTYQRDKSQPWSVEHPAFTQFGSCYNSKTNEYFCIYNPSHCEDSGVEVYVSPAETLAAGHICDCSQVHVWSCHRTSAVWCAISQEACDQDYDQFLSPHQQRLNREQNVDGLDCRLCKKKNTAAPTRSPTKEPTPTMNPTFIPIFLPSQVPLSLVEDLGLAGGDVKLARGTRHDSATFILVITFGGFFALLVIMGMVYLVFKSRNEKEYDTSKEGATHPTSMEISF